MLLSSISFYNDNNNNNKCTQQKGIATKSWKNFKNVSKNFETLQNNIVSRKNRRRRKKKLIQIIIIKKNEQLKHIIAHKMLVRESNKTHTIFLR